MKKKILLPTDFSKNAWNAICYAIELYKNEPCDFYILNTFQVSGYVLEGMMVPEPGERLYEIAKAESEKALNRTLEGIKTKEERSNHQFHTITQFNHLIDAIKDVIEKKDIEMVIMGTKGSTNQTGVVYGSNAILAMEKVRNCPVMTIPADVVYKEPKEIVFPTDYKTQVKRRELNYLIELAKINNAAIRVLHVANNENLDQEQEANKTLLASYFDDLEHSFHTLYNVDIKGGLHSFVSSRDSDMITFVNKKHSAFSTIFSKPMVKNLGKHSKVPVLALHDLRN